MISDNNEISNNDISDISDNQIEGNFVCLQKDINNQASRGRGNIYKYINM